MWQYVGHVLTVIFALYIGQSIWTLYSLYNPASCTKGKCLQPISTYGQPKQLRLFASLNPTPRSSNPGTELLRIPDLDIANELSRSISVTLPHSTRANGSLWIHAYILPQSSDTDGKSNPYHAKWHILRSTRMTVWEVPQAKAFSLVGDETGGGDKPNLTSNDGQNADSKAKMISSSAKPVTHWRSKLPIAIVDKPIPLTPTEIPGEIYHLLKLNHKGDFYPIMMVDELSYRIRDLVEVKPDMDKVNLTIAYRPVSIGRIRLLVTAQNSVQQMKGFGFKEKDVDEVKGIFTDTNFYLLALTFGVAAAHLLLDILAFKNDVSFWRNRRTLTGLSARTVLWNCCSHSVIFLYLCDENTSRLVLIPAGIGAVIEYWKVAKTFKMRGRLETDKASEEEKATESFDSQGMKYLAIVLIPLVIGGAIYSLLYIPHKSWYSWLVQSAANGVYAFGFLFMLPQLFINYKLKSVAHLPWRAFMYKAFNTFIDDLFAFIIHMPTTHRLACFRDDVVFVVYLYQRWLYPVDRSRVNEYGESFDPKEEPPSVEANENKKTK